MTEAATYGDVLAKLQIPMVRMGVWAQHRIPVRPHGWKLHLTSVQATALELLRRVASPLASYKVPFKVAFDDNILELLNEGALGETQVGKFVTVYTSDLSEEDQHALARTLIELTQGLPGPRIVTDAHLGGAVYCRYGEIRPDKQRNRLGFFEADATTRELVRYQTPFRLPAGVPDVFEVGAPPGERVELLGPGFLPVGTVAAHAKGSVYLALDMRRQEDLKKVILKQGRAGTMSDRAGRDARDRLAHQHRIEQVLRGRVRTPAIESYFEQEGDAYLAVELIDGFDLRALSATAFSSRDAAKRTELLAVLLATAAEISALHDCGFVHRDLSPNNVRISEGMAYLMDLELAHEVGDPATPFQQGTVGYVSPQQRAGEAPAFPDDVYSFGALVASLLTGLPGHLIPVGVEALGSRLHRISGAAPRLCEVAAACLSIEPKERPAMRSVVASLAQVEAVPLGAPPAADLTGCRATVEGALEWLLTSAARDERSGMWLSPALEATHSHRILPAGDWRVYRSANRGVAGVVYTLAKLWRHGVTRDKRIPTEVNRAVDWLLAHHDTPDDQLPGLHFGEAGVALAICEAVAANLIDRGDWNDPYLRQVFASSPDWPDLTHGAAGQGLAALYCGKLISSSELLGAADKYAAFLVGTQEAGGGWTMPQGVEAMADKSFTGCAHGAAGIGYFLACHASLRGDNQSLEAARRASDWLVDLATPTANSTGLSWPLTPDTTESWNWWCHGAAGIAVAFLALYRVTKEPAYAGTARACLRAISPEKRAPNLSQCHGLAGLAELLLEGAEVLDDADLRSRGLRLAGVLADLAMPVGAGLAWHVENVHSYESDLMTGVAGVIHVLARSTAGPGWGMPLHLPSILVGAP